MKFKSKVDEMLERLEAEGKATVLSDEEVQAIDEHIKKDMKNFKYELKRKFKQSEDDLKRIVLNA